ncbi:hypothetical protein MHU86_15795 [Fragilaria crotonensis]|nr:hypothetical protein MHU86_15795 [Fragilaria crotonensis]
MIISSSIKSALTGSNGTSSTYREEAGRVSSGPWLVELKEEIDIPDQPHPSFFDEYDREYVDRQSSDESRISALVQVAASASAAGDGDMELSRLALMAPAKSVAEQFPLVDIDREQSWEFACRESSLFAARPSAASRPPQDADRATSSSSSDEDQASRKRKATSKKSTNGRKRALEEPLPQRVPSSEAEDVDADASHVREEDICDDDILGGRGGLSNHHVGNKRFRKIVADMKDMYRETGVKTDKTALSRAIVEYVHKKGGRFLIKIKTTEGQASWRVMSTAESRKKTSQALRETKELKWTLSASESPTQEPPEEG